MSTVKGPKRRHAHASSKVCWDLDARRAAMAAKASADNPAPRAFSVANTAPHHSGGIELRCHHLVTTAAAAPTSDPMDARAPWASFGPHSSTTERNDVICVMPGAIGQSVLKSKPNVSLDEGIRLGQAVRMADSETELEYKQAFMARIAQARAAIGWTQKEMAEALGMPQDKYKQYETRSLLPHYLIRRFCLIARVEFEWLLFGIGKMKAGPSVEVQSQPGQQNSVKKRAKD